MSKSNWKSTSGWGTIDDPTGVLSGKVLVALGGDSGNEDYVLTDIGTSVGFDLVHYSVYMNYAWNQAAGTHPMNGGHFSAIARSGTFTGDPALAYNCYLGQIDVANNKVKIIRRKNNVEQVLAETDLSDTYKSRGVLHSLELRCYDTDPVTLQVYIDGNLVLNVGDDNADKKLTSGYAGIESKSGTVYIDNFSIYEYTADGTAPSDWTPTQLASCVVWLKADAGVTYDTSDLSVSAWSDQSGNSNDASQSNAAWKPSYTATATNGLPSIVFNGTASRMSIADVASIDLNASSASIFAIVNADAYNASSDMIVEKSTSYGLGTGVDGGNNKLFAQTSTGEQVSDADPISTSTFTLVGLVYDSGAAADATRYGFWVDGTNKGVPALVVGTDNASEMLIGSKNNSTFFDGQICELLVFNEELSIANRQLIEGYLAHKWATWNRLPTTHPYYRVAPTV